MTETHHADRWPARHYPDCWREHHACAMSRVELLTDLLRRWYAEYGGSTLGRGSKRCDEALDNETERILGVEP